MNIKRLLTTILLASLSLSAHAFNYTIDTKGAHAAIQFRIKHLGYSWLTGRFDTFSGDFSYDPENPSAAKVDVLIKTASVNSNHAERDKHLRGKDFLDTSKYPEASFNSTAFKPLGNGKFLLTGDLNLHGLTRSIDIEVAEVGAGKDPWGGYRQGFIGTTRLALKDYGINFNLGPASTHVELTLHIEGVR